MIRPNRKYSIWLLNLPIMFVCGIGILPAQSNSVRAQSSESAVVSMFRNGPAHSGSYQSTGLESFAGIQWRFQTGGAIRSSPTLAGRLVHIGSGDGFLYAIDSTTGDERWKFDARSPITSTPAVVRGRLYLTTFDGKLIALNPLSGKQIWSFKSGPDARLAWGHESGDFFTASPAPDGDRVYYASGDGHLYAVQAASGRLLWKVKTEGRIRSSPAVVNNTVFVGSFDGRLYAVDAKTGTIKWRYDTEGTKLNSGSFGFDRKSIQSSPAVDGDLVIFGARDGFLYAVDIASGQLRWRFDHEVSWVNSSPAVADHMVYVGSSDARFVNCVDTRTGKEVWRFKSDGLVWSSPAIAGRTLYVGDSLGNLYALDRTNGKELWRYRASRRIFSSPVIMDSRIYFGSDDGHVYALNLSASPLQRAVFWDGDFVKGASNRGHEALRDYLKDNSYKVVNDRELPEFLRARIKDRAPSVLLFAIDHLPETVSSTGGGKTLIREYLDSGGRVVWVGVPPLIWPRDLKSGERDFTNINRDATQNLLGVNHRRANFDTYTAITTNEGRRWGLTGWSLSNWGAEPLTVSTVLALDEQGLATSWVRRFTGPPGTGFVRVPLIENIRGEPLNMPEIKIAAEYLPR